MVLTTLSTEEFHEVIKKAVSEELLNFKSIAILPITEPPVTTAELCKFLRISEPTVIRMKKRGKIPFIAIGGSIRYDLPKVLMALEVQNGLKAYTREHYNKNYKKDQVSSLNDNYIKSKLKRSKYVSPEAVNNPNIIETKRSLLKLKREIKNGKENS